jgi:hypothetical protein
MHWNQEAQRQLVHLLREDFGGLERVGYVLNVVVDNGVTALAHAGLGDGILEDLQCFLVQLKAPVI